MRLMKILILDTSSEKSFVLLADGHHLIASLSLSGGPDLSKTIALKLKNLLDEHSFAPEGISAGQGPGSYTGVRVGVALAKSLALGWKVPLIGICSLKFFMPEEPTSPSLILFDARIAGCYGIDVETDGTFGLPRLISLEELKTIPPKLLLCSPHPSTLQKRLSLPNPWLETEPNFNWAIQEAQSRFKEKPLLPLVLDYLSPTSSPPFS